MKVLVNSYSANRALAILSEVEVDLHQLALWTILCSRWPLLADHLSRHPDTVATIGAQNGATFGDASLDALRTDPEVVKVVAGGAGAQSLIQDTLERCAPLR